MGERLRGAVAVVTGAGGGLGRSEATLLAREGASVVVNNRWAEESPEASSADRVVAEIASKGGVAVASRHDVSRPDGATGVVATAIQAFGRLDILINNAGVARVGPVESQSDEDWSTVVGASLHGTFMVTRAAIPHLRRSHGVILNTSSESGLGHAFLASYAAAKEGLVGLTRSLARELAADSIRCNAIRPRVTGTKMGEQFHRAVAPYATELAALGRYRMGERAGVGGAGTPDETAPFAVWLCTPAAERITGRIFSIEGDTIGLWSEPVIERTAVRADGWDLNTLDQAAPSLFAELRTQGLALLLAQSAPTVERS